MKKSAKKKSVFDRKWFREKHNSIIIVPINIWGWLAILWFIGFLFLVAYVNFGYENTPLKSAMWFMLDMILTVWVVGRLFDKKSDKKA